MHQLPSEYIKEITQCPEITLSKRNNLKEIEHPYFRSNPRMIVFRRYKVGKIYFETLQVINKSEVRDKKNKSFEITK